MLGQQQLQLFDVVIVNDLARPGYGPLEAVPQTALYFGNQLLPARETVLTRERQLGIAVGQGRLAGQLLRLLAQGFQ
jgi:hypothetical protein